MAKPAAVAREARRAFSPCHQGATSVLCGKEEGNVAIAVLILRELAGVAEGIVHVSIDVELEFE